MIRSKLHQILAHVPPKELPASMPVDPFFVFSEEVIELLNDSEASDASLRALAEHGLVHLPYPDMTVQFQTHTGKFTWVVSLHERPDGQIVGYPYWTRRIDETVGQGANVLVENVARDCFTCSVQKLEGQTAKAAKDTAAIVAVGVKMAVLMTHIGGLEREEHEPEERLNKARERRGKPAVRGYSYIHVGHYYSSDGTKHDYNKTGRRMPIHMRAGHNRRQHYGPERAEVKLIWIPPVLVNYRGGDKPVLEKRIVL